MSTSKGIWFVYRSHYAGPLSRRVCRLDAPSVLAWFQDRIADARGAARPAEVADVELGGSVHGLGTFFEAVKKHQLPAPKSISALRKVLREHLRVDGGPDDLRLDDHALRVLTGDERVKLAYFFFDDEATREHATRLAFLMHEEAELPEGDADEGFTPPLFVPVLESSGGAGGEGATYACLLTFHGGRSIPGEAGVFPGVRLAGLAAHLRGVVPAAKPASWSADWLDTWPVELRLLRAMMDEGDAALGPALLRAAAYPLDAVVGQGNHTRLGIGPHAAARAEFEEAAAGQAPQGDPGQSFVRESEHVSLLCAHASARFGFQQWIFFDDRWAAENPDLAESILRYAREWDPFPWSDPSKRSAAEGAAEKQSGAWDEAVAGRAVAEARRYRPSERFAAGELLDHAKFGLGVVRRAEATTIEVTFRDATRKLAHGLTG